MLVKTCTKCDKVKGVGDNFYYHSIRQAYEARCSSCACGAAKLYRARNPEKVARSKAVARARNPEKYRAAQALWISKNRDYARVRTAQKLYGLTAEQYQSLDKSACSVCARALSYDGTKAEKPNLDHCHSTGRFRGVLCNNCNLSLGNAKDSPARLRALASYLERL